MRSLFFIFSFLILYCGNSQCQDTGYIKMQYVGETSKPHEIVFFYLPNSIDTAYEEFFVHKFQIDRCEFRDINRLIKNWMPYSDSNSLKGPYLITIVNDDQKDTVISRSITHLKQLFNDIALVVLESKKRELVRRIFDGIIRRLWSK